MKFRQPTQHTNKTQLPKTIKIQTSIMKLTTAIVVFASTIATANGKRSLRRELELEESYYSMSMPEALDVAAMKGSEGSGKAGKVPVGAEKFVGTYYKTRPSFKGVKFATDAPEYDLTNPSPFQYDLRQVEEGTVTEITLEGDAVSDYQLLNVVRGDEVVEPAVAFGDRTFIFGLGFSEIILADVPGTKSLDGSIELEIATRLASISPCVCDTAEYLDARDLTEDLTIETKGFVTPDFDLEQSFICVRLVRQGKGWIGLGINPGRPENDSGVGDNGPPNPPRNAMQGAEAVIGTLKDGDQPQAVLKYHLNGGNDSSGGAQRVELFPPEKQTLVCPSITYDKKRDETTMVFGKYFQEEDEYEIKVGEENTFLYAYGGTTLGYHGGLNRGVFSSADLDTIEILCAGTGEGRDTVPARTSCPTCSYAGSVPECIA